jgi:hypothetical protein
MSGDAARNECVRYKRVARTLVFAAFALVRTLGASVAMISYRRRSTSEWYFHQREDLLKYSFA